jgi:hypothetical protein
MKTRRKGLKNKNDILFVVYIQNIMKIVKYVLLEDE